MQINASGEKNLRCTMQDVIIFCKSTERVKNLYGVHAVSENRDAIRPIGQSSHLEQCGQNR